ncbi:type II toxin-antitoxin system VapC family toxin [Humibacter antri]
MRALLDTHVLLWWLADDPRLSARHRDVIADPGNEILVSAVTIAEMAIKASLDKLDAPDDVAGALAEGGFEPLALSVAHAVALRTLPWHHRDPFDRMLVAQASVEHVPLLSSDPHIAEYDIEVVT